MRKTPSYLIESFRCTKAQIKYLEDFVDEYRHHPFLEKIKNRDKLYAALAHLVASSLICPSWDEFQRTRGIPMPSQTWRAFGGAAAWQCLSDIGILKITNYQRDEGKCREFRLVEFFLLDYTKAGIDDESARPYNLVSKKLMRKRLQTSLVDYNRNKYFKDSEVNRQALKVWKAQRCLYNLAKLKAVLNEFEEIATRYPSVKNRMRLINARSAFLTIHKGGSSRYEPGHGKGIYSYQPCYSVVSTGRLIENGVGLQGCPKEMKAAAFDIDGVYNYDLAASQAYGLLRLVSAFRIRDGALKKDYNFEHISRKPLDPTWLRNYLNGAGDAHRRAMAADAGISYRQWKELFYATVMGGAYSTFITTLTDEASAKKAYTLLKPLRDIRSAVVDRILLYVRDELSGYNPKRLKEFGHKILRVEHSATRAWIVNAAGARAMAFTRWGDLLDGWNDRRIMAHILQGIEAHYIAEITAFSQSFGFNVMSNQHDGLVTLGEIPVDCIKAAQKSSSLGKMGQLVQKGFL